MIVKFKPHRLPVAVLIATVLILFWPVLLHPFAILYPTFSPFSDVMIIHWPKAQLMAQSWQAGQGLPHWTPLILSGMPLAANQLAMLCYPPAWLFLILPLAPVFNLLFIFHLLLGGFGVYVLLSKVHRLSPSAALLGGMTFALNGKWLAHAAGGHVSMVGAIGWLPWAVMGVMMLLQGAEEQESGGGRQFWRDGRVWWAVLAAVALGMEIVTHTLLVIYTVYLIGAVCAWHFIFIRSRNLLAEARRLWLPLLLIPVLGGLLGAAQLLPLAELAQFSNRALNLSEAIAYAVTPVQLLVGLFLPSAQAGHELIIYLGLVPLLLATLGLAHKNRWAWFYGLLLIFTILFALGPSTPVHSFFYYVVPGFRWVRTPARMFFVGGFATAALVGFGIDRLAHHSWSPSAKRWLARLALALGTLTLLTGLGLAFAFGQTTRAAFALALFIPLGLGLILLRVQRILSIGQATTLLGVLLFLDLATFDASLMKFVPPEQAFPGRPAADYLAAKLPTTPATEPAPDLFRVYSPSYSLPMQTAAAANLHLADGVEPVHLAVYDQYMAEAGGYHQPGFSVTVPNFGEGPLESALSETEPNLKLLGLLNVVYLASAFPMDWPGLTLETTTPETYIYRNDYALPRAWVAHQAIPAETDWLAQLENLSDLSTVVLLSGTAEDQSKPSDQVPVGGTTAPNQPGDAVEVLHYSSDLIEMATKIDTPGWLVVSEIWYPGWQATVNGTARPVLKANGLLRAVYLDRAGTYDIKLAYRPQSIVWGSRISGAAAGLLILGGLWRLIGRNTKK